MTEPTLHTEDFYVSTDPKLLDTTWIVNTLLSTYFGSWRTHEIIHESIRNSICFGVYQHSLDPMKSRDRQIGFARAVTDYATISWVCDVVIEPEFQNKGLGSFLMNSMLENAVINRRSVYLRTRDAHDFYAKFGFVRLDTSEVMNRVPKP